MWRMSGSNWYAWGNAYLNYKDSSGNYVKAPNSDVINTTPINSPVTFESAAFGEGPISAQEWQVYITSHMNPDYQSQFQLYLREVQFGFFCDFVPPSASPTGKNTFPIDMLSY